MKLYELMLMITVSPEAAELLSTKYPPISVMVCC